MSNLKRREFYMDRDTLDACLRKCDLGDGYNATVRQYPHKSMLSDLVFVREVSTQDELLMQSYREMLEALKEISIEAARNIQNIGFSARRGDQSIASNFRIIKDAALNAVAKAEELLK